MIDYNNHKTNNHKRKQAMGNVTQKNEKSISGTTKIARIILKRFTNAKAWEDYWQNKMNCAGNVVINIGNYKCFSQNSGQ